MAMAMAVAFRSAPALAKFSFLLSTTETRLAIAMAVAFRSAPALAKISFWATKWAKAREILFLRS
jgi:hypothetical protein